MKKKSLTFKGVPHVHNEISTMTDDKLEQICEAIWNGRLVEAAQ